MLRPLTSFRDSVPVLVRAGPHGAGPRGSSPVCSVPEDERPNYRDKHRKSDDQEKQGNGAEPFTATVLVLFVTLPATSFLR